MAKKFYVVWAGRTPGIYQDWGSCKAQVDQFAGARYKSFPTEAEAKAAFSGSGRPATTPTKGRSTSRRSNNGVKTYSSSEVAALAVTSKLFTDGGCEPNPGKAGSGLALYRDEQLAELWYGLFNPQGTNNSAELNALHQAMLMAAQEHDAGHSVAIFCDSKYAIQCITQWAAGWQKKGWKREGGEIKNLSLIQAMFQQYQQIKPYVQILHVNGHVGIEGNELADRMSILAIDTQQRDFQRYREALDISALLALRSG
jgi:ribonuclease HI